MMEFMEKVSASIKNEELTVKGQNLFSVTYKNMSGPHRSSWRIISLINQKEENSGNEDHVAMIRNYRSKIKNKLSNIYDNIP
ncbi:hypothetical protein UlMin_016718 [Ulmus minor]